jgi:hypothetical protein
MTDTILRCRRAAQRRQLAEKLDRAPGLAAWVVSTTDVQACPVCSTLVQRSHGCAHMVCFICKTDFCYDCGEETSFGTARTCGTACHKAKDGDAPRNGARSSLCADILAVKRERVLFGLLLGTHARLGRDSPVLKLPTDAVRTIAKLVMEIGG